MSSDSQSLIAAIQFNDCLSIATATVVAYDYVITLTNEIEYIWGQSWTAVSTLFVVVRYLGFLTAMVEALCTYWLLVLVQLTLVTLRSWQLFYTWPYLSVSKLAVRSSCLNQVRIEGTVLTVVSNWSFVLFLAAADLVMILRVYAMYQGSRTILGVLLSVYVPTIVLLAVSTGYYNNPKTFLSVSTFQVLNVTVCSINYTSPSRFDSYAFIPRFILAVLMFALSMFKFVAESAQAYKAAKRWMPNRYIALLVREGVLYFSAHLLYNVNLLITGPMNSNSVGVAGIVIDVLSYILLFILCPRFILSVREMYDQDCRRGGRRSQGIDTGFGLGSQWRENDMAAMGSIRFADVGLNETEEQVQDTQRLGIRTTEC